MTGLQATDIAKSFAGAKALQGVSLGLQPRSITGLIGPNGSGKTTLLNIISGATKPDSGRIELEGENVAGKPAHYRARKGLARTFQNIRLFPEMTVEQNCLVSLQAQGQGRNRDNLLQALDLLGIAKFAKTKVSELAYGIQRRVELARAIASSPRFLLLDEPAAGMNPQETSDLISIIQEIKDKYEMSVLVIEHDLGLISALCDTVMVLDAGQKISEGTPQEVRSDPAVVEAYIGRAAARRSNMAPGVPLQEEP